KGTEFEQAVPLFWIFFPDAREILYNTYAFNEKNSALQTNYDFLFNARKFAGTIYKTDNVYGDRNISEYVRENAMMQLLEAERIKESIRDFEDDLWNYKSSSKSRIDSLMRSASNNCIIAFIRDFEDDLWNY